MSSLIIAGSATNFTGSDLEPLFNESGIRLLASRDAGQPFSLTNGNIIHKFWAILDEFMHFVPEIQAELVTMENIPELADRGISSTSLAQPSLNFVPIVSATVNNATPSSAILGFLRIHGGWQVKPDVLAANRITAGEYAAISKILAAGHIECEGEQCGALYRYTGVEG